MRDAGRNGGVLGDSRRAVSCAANAILAAAHEPARAGPRRRWASGVIALGVLVARGRLRMHEDDPASATERRASAARLGNRLFVPALAIPLVTLALVLAAPYLRWNATPLLDPRSRR